MSPRRRQKGLYVVEFAVVSGIFLFIVFAALEVSRLMFTWSALDAVTQRGARVAAVCPPNDATVARIAIFGDDGGSSTVVPGIGTSNIGLAYLDEDQAATADVAAMKFVRVSIVGYTHQMLIPEVITGFVSPSLLSPTFETTRPAESLGWDPDNGTRSCF